LKLVNEEMVVKTDELEYKTKTPMGIGRFLTQKVIRPDKDKRLITHELHGATYTMLKANDDSNRGITDIYTHKSDAYFRSMVIGRVDCLPTPAKIQRWFTREAAANARHCRGCRLARGPTFAYLLNECPMDYQMMTERHNRIARVVKESVLKFVDENFRSDLDENTTIAQEGLPDR
jgi:hypothetical protein